MDLAKEGSHVFSSDDGCSYCTRRSFDVAARNHVTDATLSEIGLNMHIVMQGMLRTNMHKYYCVMTNWKRDILYMRLHDFD